MRTVVYIDGFNLYYGCLRGTRLKWLDLDAFCRRLLPRDELVHIRYFTARVSARPNDPTAPQRQQIYLRALATIPHLSIHYGQFLTKTVQMPLAMPSRRGGPTTVEVIKTEEKGSDVNIATYMLLDGFQEKYECAVLISNDSDLTEPVRVVRDVLHKATGVINPHVKNRPSVQLQRAATFVREVRQSTLRQCQFPPELSDLDGRFRPPNSW